MKFFGIYIFLFATIVLTLFVPARAVNISNTWMLPEEGFPVFYRYFRDRISWYEADAVCQFHHANLVTAQSTSEYDAIRAYLKELDISEDVWIGLSRPTGRPNFMWTNFQLLSGEGYWQQPIPDVNEAVCVVMDPVADFLWKPLTCGGPDIASFICELPVPSWAMGPKGCLFTELPSLTVLYIPEQLALELTSDCGLDGTKRIVCKGNADREEILKQLTCAMPSDEFDEKSTRSPILSNTATNTIPEMSSEENSKTTKPWIWTSNTIDIDYGMPTRHRRETEDTLSPSSTKSTTDLSLLESQNKNKTSTKSLNDDIETTSFTPEEFITLGSMTSILYNKSAELKPTEMTDSITQNTDEQSETSESVFTTTESKTDGGVDDTGEYPSAIGQGQLFGIIENGTMFDIIEVNETSTDDIKLGKDVMMETPQSESEILKTSTDHSSDNLYTTVVYQKEPPAETNFVTNKSVKKVDKLPKKHTFKEKDPKKSNQDITDKPAYGKTNVNNFENKMLSKEVEMFPIATDPFVKLNRTFRKELPPSDDVKSVNDVNLENATKEPSDLHQHIEIKWHQEENSNLLPMKIFITTKRTDSQKQNQKESEEKRHNIDPRKDFPVKKNDTKNNSSNDSKQETATEDSAMLKKQFLPKSLVVESQTDVSSVPAPSNEPLEPEPEAQPRPNRQRQLTRPQRRSFYPYFFSRVLG